MSPMRCQHYFDDGQPVREGCHYEHNCLFVHPHHYQWDTAVPPTRQREKIYGPQDYTRGPKSNFVVEKTASYNPYRRGLRRSPSPISPSRGRLPGAGHRRDDSYLSNASKASVERERRRDYDLDHGDPGSSASGSRSKAKMMDVDASPTTRRDYERPRTPQRDRERGRETERDRGRDRSPGERANPFSPTRADQPPTTPGATTTTMGMTTSPRSPRAPPTAPRWLSLRSQQPQDSLPPPPSSAPPLSLNMAANAGSSSSSSAMPAPPPTAPLHRPPPLPLSPPPPPNSAPMQSSRPGPSQTKPLGPLPVVPDLPSILQLKQDTPGASTEDASKKEKLWEDRIKLIADSVLVYESIQRLQDEQETAQKILNSTFFSTLDPSARERLVAQNTELQSRLDNERATLRRQGDALVSQSFWPTAPPRRVSREEEQQYAEMKGFVRDLNSEVMSMKSLLSEIEEIKRAGVRKDKGKGKERAHDEDERMFVDEGGDGDVSMSETALPQATGVSNRKRRRLSSGEAAPSAAASASDTRVTDPASPDYIPTAAELEALRDMLLKCNHDITDMQNEVTRANHDWADTVRTAVEAEMEAERARRREEVEEREREAQQERTRQKEEVRRRVEEVKGQVGDLGGQVVEVTESLAGLVLQAGKLEEEVEEARSRRERAFERLAEIEVKMKSYTDAQARNAEAISTLRTAIEAYLTQPPSPPVSPAPTATVPALVGPDAAALPPVEYILQSLEPALTNVARATMRPLLEQLRQEMEKVIKENNAEMYRAFHEKMGKARQVVHAISQHLPQLAQQAGAAQAGSSGTRAGGSAGPQGKAPSGTSTRMA